MVQLRADWSFALLVSVFIFALKRAIADNDQAGCGPDVGGLPCYNNQRTLTFIPKGAEYYDLEMKLTGTDRAPFDRGSSVSARKVSGLETLRFENGKYVQTSHEGDLTALDKLLAKPEELK
jgi:hypothetical protein